MTFLHNNVERRQGTLSPCRLSRLVVNYIVVYDFRSSATNVIHLSNPLHLIVCFEFFCHALTLCHLFYEPKKHILSLLIYIGKVSVQFAFCEQGRIKTFAVRHRSKSVLASKYRLRVLITSAFNRFINGSTNLVL